MHSITPRKRSRETCQATVGETCGLQGVGPKWSTLKPTSLVSVTACKGKAAVCQRLKVVSPDIVAPQRHPNLSRHPGWCAEGIPLPRVYCRRSYRTYRSSGYRCGCLTELTEVPGTGINPYRTHRSPGYCGTGVQNLQKSQAGTKMLLRYSGYCERGRTEITDVPGTGMKVVQNLQTSQVRV